MANEFENSAQTLLQQEVKTVAHDLGEVAQHQLKDPAEAGKEQPAKGVESLSAAIDKTAASMQGKQKEQLASFADRLHQSSVDEARSA